ncbi:MAG TPA: hypothetical protein VK783_01220 [Bacteroidia bacterium]|jgi:hypothetical protein|nr:hypothetical protein [Bacteroidia bacterium]
MKDELKKILSKDDNWKYILRNDSKELKDARLVSLDIVTIDEEDKIVYFDASIVYGSDNGVQRQAYESGAVTVEEGGSIKMVKDKARKQKSVKGVK